VAAVVLFVRYAADPLTERLARAPELLVIFAIALAAMFAAVGDASGLGKEVGGLMAGVALASTPYRETIAARLAPCATSCCCSSSSRWAPRSTCRCSARMSPGRSSSRCSC
jgi:Kef-type K+ transport system membrane component KefB